jgi:hypothetical protein
MYKVDDQNLRGRENSNILESNIKEVDNIITGEGGTENFNEKSS